MNFYFAQSQNLNDLRKWTLWSDSLVKNQVSQLSISIELDIRETHRQDLQFAIGTKGWLPKALIIKITVDLKRLKIVSNAYHCHSTIFRGTWHRQKNVS